MKNIKKMTLENFELCGANQGPILLETGKNFNIIMRNSKGGKLSEKVKNLFGQIIYLLYK